MSISAPDQLRPLALYESMYTTEPRRFAAPTGGDALVWETWQSAFRSRLRQRLGDIPSDTERGPVAISIGQTTTHDGYQRTYIEFESAPSVVVPAWLLVPTGLTGPAPGVIALHGHGYGVDDAVGIRADGSEREQPEGYHQHFALELCRRGMVVIAPELSGFGRRREPIDQNDTPDKSSCHSASWWGIMLGKPLLGSRVWDTLRTLDLLQSRPEVDPERIGVMGGSGGGAVALLASALEPRLRAVVLSNYFCTFRASILAITHCHCNYVPGLLQDCEMYDLAALIAPRPLLIATGVDDPIFPLHGVLEAYKHLRDAYESQGAADHLDQDLFAGGHQINGAKAYEFLWRYLSPGLIA